jgi:hypothetical protein
MASTLRPRALQFVDVIGKVLSVTTAPHVPWASAENPEGVTKLLRLRCVTALVSLFEGRTDYTVHSRVVSQVRRAFAPNPNAHTHTREQITPIRAHMRARTSARRAP